MDQKSLFSWKKKIGGDVLLTAAWMTLNGSQGVMTNTHQLCMRMLWLWHRLLRMQRKFYKPCLRSSSKSLKIDVLMKWFHDTPVDLLRSNNCRRNRNLAWQSNKHTPFTPSDRTKQMMAANLKRNTNRETGYGSGPLIQRRNRPKIFNRQTHHCPVTPWCIQSIKALDSVLSANHLFYRKWWPQLGELHCRIDLASSLLYIGFANLILLPN